MKKLVKSFLSILLVCAILFGAAPLSGFKGVASSLWHGLCSLAVSAKEEVEGLFETHTPANVSDNKLATAGQCGDNVYWTFDEATGALNIYGEGDMYSYLNNSTFYDKSSIESVVIETGVTSIGKYAFSGCSSLTSVEIPDSVTRIGDYAFQSCSELSSATIGNGVTSIGSYAFRGCSSLTSVSIGNSVTSIGRHAFNDCNKLNFVIAEDIASWCNIDFAGEYSNPMRYAKIFRTPEEIVYDLVIPDTVEQIKDYAFYNCQFLKSVTVPDSVKTIGNSAFLYCSRLEEVSFGDGLRSVGSNAFSYRYYYNSSLKKVNVKDVTSWLKIDFADGTSNPLYRAQNLYVNGELAEEIIVDGVDVVKKNTFCNCTSIKKVTIGDQVKEIDDNAFANCSNLSSLIIGSNIERIGSYAFLGCNITGALTIPGSVKTIGYQAFNKSESITNINILDGVEIIGENAFANCTSITNVSIPASVTTMGYGAFYKSSQITDVYYAKTKADWDWLGGTEYFGLDYYKVNVHFGAPCAVNGHTAGDEWVVLIPATKYQTGLASKQCTICGSVLETKIIPRIENIVDPPEDEDLTSGQCGRKVFWSFDEETGTLTISGKGEMYNYYSGNYSPFYSNALINTVVIESGVTSVGNSAFSYCTSLTSVEIPESVTRIGQYAFYECNITGELKIPSNVDTVGYQSFEKNRNLETLTLSEGVRVIGENAFALCERLKIVNVSSTVERLYYGAFYGCSNLVDVYYALSLYEWNNLGGTEYYGLDMDKVHVHFAKDHASGQCGENVFWTLDSETGNLTISGEGKMYNYSFDGSPFFDKTSIKSVIIESGVTSIGDYAFFVCSSLTSIVIPNSVTSIGDYAFSYCGSLTSIVIPDSVTSIGSSAFTNCKSLTNVKLGSRVSFIGVNGFAECESIRSISLPDSIVSIGNKVFSGCVRLNDVYYSDCQKWKDVNVGTGNANLTEVNFHFTTHHYNDVGEATPPTCTQKGYTTYTCSVCNDTYVDNYVNAKGHTLGECVVTQEPSGTKPGVKTYYCSVCGDYVASELFYNDEDKPQTKPIVKGVSVSDLSVDYLEPTTINPTITADEGASYTVSYTSSNPSVATVDDNGKVTSVKQSGLNRGSTVITCKVTDSYGNTATDTCTVTVQFAWWQWLLKIVLFGWLWY